MSQPNPTDCNYAPPGEYVKDHTIVFHDGWYHLFSISGTEGYYHGYNGNEETLSWSISKDLVHWEFRGHILHATQRANAFDQHEIWAPFCIKGHDGFYLFYTGIIHPHRPMEYRRLGHRHPWVFDGHKETQGLAFSKDMTDWCKIADFTQGLNIPGRDSHVVRDDANARWLLYSTVGIQQAHVAVSTDLLHWHPIGICAEFPTDISKASSCGATTNDFGILQFNTAESLTVMKHPLNGKWLMLANWHYLISDNPLDFSGSSARTYDRDWQGASIDLGFACETICFNGRWFRSGVFGKQDHWKLGFTEITWSPDAAFSVAQKSILA